MEKLFAHTEVYLYAYVDTSTPRSPSGTSGWPTVVQKVDYWRISITSHPMKFPRKKEPLPEDVFGFNIWGREDYSQARSPNSLASCSAFMDSLATIFTISGYNVYCNDKEFDPVDGMDPIIQ